MTKWICECGKKLSTDDSVNGYEVINPVNDLELNSSISFIKFDKNYQSEVYYKCPKCGRIWFDSDSRMLNNSL